MLCFVYSQEAEYAEGSSVVVPEELDELRRSFSARLRSESLQRQSDNLEKDSRIEHLENILKLQLQREKRKDRKIAELEERVETIAPLRCGELSEERASSSSKEDEDKTLQSQSERARTDKKETENRIISNRPQVATSKVLEGSGDESTSSTSSMKVGLQDEKLERDNREASFAQEQRLPSRQASHRIKIPFLSKLMSS